MRLEQRDDYHGVLAALRLVDADAVGEGEVARLGALEVMLLAVELDHQLARAGVDRPHGADVAVEEVLVVVVPELDDLVARAELAAGGAHHLGPTVVPGPGRVECGLQLEVEVGHAGHALVHRSEYLHVVHGVRPLQLPRHELGAKLADLFETVLRRIGRDEREVGPHRRGVDVGRRGRDRRVAAVDRVRGGHDLALALLAVNDVEPGHRDRSEGGGRRADGGGDQVL